MASLPRRLLAYVWLIAILAMVVAAPLAAQLGPPSGVREWLALLLVPPMLAIALRFPLHLSAKTQHDTTATPVIVAVVLLVPPLAILAVGLGMLAGELMKPTRRGAQVAFNVSVAVLAVAVATFVAGPIGALGTHGLLAAGVAGAVYWTVGNVATEFIIALQLGKKPFRQWRGRNLEAARHEWSLLAVGVIVALLAAHEPWALVLLPVPVSIVYRSFLYQERRLRLAEAGRAEAEGERARLTAIIEATPDFVATADPFGRVLYLNEAGRSMLGLGPAESLDGLALGAAFPGWEAASSAASEHGAWTGESAVLVRGRAPVPVSKVVLAHRGTGAVEFLSVVARDITAQKELERRLFSLAGHDALTGLLNRRAFDDELQRVLSAPGAEGTLFFLDLDGFKVVNDRFGHETGDRLLRDVATALRDAVAGEGLVARLGGDEFAVIVEGMSPEAAEAVAVRLSEAVAAVRSSDDGQTVTAAVSVGFAVFPVDASTPRDVLSRADAAMYAAKKGGRAPRRYRDAA